MPSFTMERMTLIDFLGFDRIAAGGRLVEQQHLRLAGQRARDFEALEGAIGERTGRTIGGIGEADAGKRRARRFAGRLDSGARPMANAADRPESRCARGDGGRP